VTNKNKCDKIQLHCHAVMQLFFNLRHHAEYKSACRGVHFISREMRWQFMKRSDYITWDQYFMGIAIMSANRSKDPNTQVGACIVDQDNRILTVGYNGMPSGCNDDEMPWDREGEGMASKYFFVCHAELNAILNYRGGGTLRGSRCYVTLFPCNECAKAIIQSGIKEVIYMCDKYADSESTMASKKMFEMAGVKYTEYENQHKKIEFEL
jgi:dCMP deaminase